MSINLQKMQDLQFFYGNVSYYVNKGGQDGMAELDQQYQTLVKMYQIKVPQITRLLEALADLKLSDTASSKPIAQLERVAMRFAQKQHHKLTAQLTGKATKLLPRAKQ